MLKSFLWGVGLCIMAAGPAASAERLADLAGTWAAEAKTQAGGDLKLVLHIRPDGSGEVDPPAGAPQVALNDLTLEHNVLSFSVPSIPAWFDGTLAGDASTIDGAWQQGGDAVMVSLTRTAGPDAAAGGAYQSQEVSFPSAAPGITLAGTLTKPQGEGPFPAVLLVTGSGPQDRDETLVGHKPFLVIADHLTKLGYAVLRYDDRGVGASAGDFDSARMSDFVEDTLGALAFLRKEPGIDGARVGILGHSEGALVAARAADAVPGVAFLIFLAGPAEPMSDLLVAQAGALARSVGASSSEASAQEDLQRKLVDAARAAASPEAATAAVSGILAGRGIGKDRAAAEAATVVSPWFYEFVRYDPKADLEALTMPVLSLYGGKDIQVDAAVNAPLMRAALKNARSEVTTLDTLNHLFQPADTGAIAEYGTIETTIDPTALAAIDLWLKTLN
jgi:pimeloyl-ACP methyl ester carboxylesterase